MAFSCFYRTVLRKVVVDFEKSSGGVGLVALQFFGYLKTQPEVLIL